MDVTQAAQEAGTVVAVVKEIRTVVIDVEAIFNRHYMNALNDKVGTMVDHWKHALAEILGHAAVEIQAPATSVVAESAPLRTAAEIATATLEVKDQAAAITERVTADAIKPVQE